MFDTIIIGGGPAGYIAAERLAHEKKKVLLIEDRYLGGTCLNAGCIPAKTLINSAKQYFHAREASQPAEKFGIKVEGVSFDWEAVQSWKAEVVSKLRSGIEGQMKRLGVEVINGRGEIISPPSGEKPAKVKTVSPNHKTADTSTIGHIKTSPISVEYEGKTILICAGSVPVMPPIPGAMNNPYVVDSTGLLSIETVPKRLAVIGGGVIGIEFAGLFSALGSQVTVIEMADEIVPFMDREQAPVLRRAMKGVDFKLGCKVEKIDARLCAASEGSSGAIVYYTAKTGAAEKLETDLVLMAVGRRPSPDTFGAAAAGIEFSTAGVCVDDRMRTNVAGIWAAGDVTGKSLLAHSAYRMGEVAASEILCALGHAEDKTNVMRYDAIPWAVYGITEAAGVGMTEQDAAAKGIAVLKASLPMRVSGRFVAENSLMGMGAVKVIADASSRRILGIHAVGSYASEFIWGGAAIIEKEMRIDDVKRLIFPHPTVCELIRDAVRALK